MALQLRIFRVTKSHLWERKRHQRWRLKSPALRGSSVKYPEATKLQKQCIPVVIEFGSAIVAVVNAVVTRNLKYIKI